MALGIVTEASGNFVPFIKFDARAGRWFRKADRERGEAADVDITNGFAAVFDFENIEVGWMYMAAGQAPAYVMQHVSKGIPPKPEGEFKQGFRMRVMLSNDLGGGVYELAASAKAIISRIDAAHTIYSQAAESKQNKLPIFACTGTDVIETQTPKGVTRNYAPQFVLSGWVDRPAGLAGEAAAAPAPAPVSAGPAATGSTAVPPPSAPSFG